MQYDVLAFIAKNQPKTNDLQRNEWIFWGNMYNRQEQSQQGQIGLDVEIFIFWSDFWLGFM